MVACLQKHSKNHAHHIKQPKNPTQIATNGGLPTKTIKKPCAPSKRQKSKQKTLATNGGLFQKNIKKPMHIASTTQEKQKKPHK